MRFEPTTFCSAGGRHTSIHIHLLPFNPFIKSQVKIKPLFAVSSADFFLFEAIFMLAAYVC